MPAERAAEYILGVTCVNDVTARALQKTVGHYTRPKGFDTFAPIGPCIAVGLDWSNLRVRGWVNGTLRQDSTTADLIFPVPELVAFISSVMTLLPGDIISTGTPSGIGPLGPATGRRLCVGDPACEGRAASLGTQDCRGCRGRRETGHEALRG